MAAVAERRSSFDLKIRNAAGKVLSYSMHIERVDGGHLDHCVVHYRYGALGTRGNSSIKSFFDNDDRSGFDAARDFVEAKYFELWEKGYRETIVDESEQDVASSLPVRAPGETIYLEWKDKYDNSDKSFYQLTLREREGAFLVIALEGDIGGKGQENGFSFGTLDEAVKFIADSVLERKQRNYKKKAPPKKIRCKIMRDWDWSEAENSDNSDEDEEDAVLVNEEAIIAPQTANKGEVCAEAASPVPSPRSDKERVIEPPEQPRKKQRRNLGIGL